MMCITVHDFLRLGGYPEFSTWGGEDNDLFKTVKDFDLKVVRKYDHGLLHLYHFNNCTKDVELIEDKNRGHSKLLTSCKAVQKIADE